MFTTVALLLTAAAPADGVELKFIASGAVEKSGGYRPVRAQLSDDASGIKKKPDGLSAARYGKITFGDKSVAFILDEPADKAPSLYVDTNNDGDLTNDPKASWEAKKNGQATIFFGNAKVDIGKPEPIGVNLYRFDPKDPARAALKDTVLYYGDFGYEVKLTLDGKTFATFLAGEPGEQSSLTIDRNGDGKISYKREVIAANKPFNFTGTTYVLKPGKGNFTLEKAAEKLPIATLPPELGVGKAALPFTAKATDGSTINFPGDYKGKVVMLDFWATWCGPCIAELPNVKKAYEKWNSQGFEIVGISFDQKDYAEKLAEFTKKNDMPWKQIYEGKFWDTTLGGMYDVSGIPFVLLVDGDTGKILATERELRGPGIVETIEKALAAKKS